MYTDSLISQSGCITLFQQTGDPTIVVVGVPRSGIFPPKQSLKYSTTV